VAKAQFPLAKLWRMEASQMLKEIEIAQCLGQDTERTAYDASKELSFNGWLIMHKSMRNKWADIVTYNANRLLRVHDCPFPTRPDAERMAIAVLTSTYSKSHQRHLLIALQYYMEYLGIVVKFNLR
jgi:hypothetical protein